MSDRNANGAGNAEPVYADIDVATRRLMMALDALEAAAERRRDADRDENELASRIQALGADRSRLADELDGSLVKTRRLERTNREVSEKLDVAIGIAPPFRRGLERIERHHQAPRGDIDIGIDRLGIAGPVGVTIAHEGLCAPWRRPAARRQNPRFGKRLEHEIYVASERSATPARSYAPLSNFRMASAFPRLGLTGIVVLSSPDFPLGPRPYCGLARYVPTTKHLISGGFLS